MSYLTTLPGASKRLKIFNADLNQPNSFSTAIQDCIGVFHVAHPMDVHVTTDQDDAEADVTRRAVGGTLGILEACVHSKTVRKVIYTSSAATILFNEEGTLEMADEETWSDLENCGRRNKIIGFPYLVSKTMTERLVLEFGERKGMKLEVVSLVLPLVVGPFICPNIPASVYIALSMILGMIDTLVFSLSHFSKKK